MIPETFNAQNFEMNFLRRQRSAKIHFRGVTIFFDVFNCLLSTKISKNEFVWTE